MDLLERFADLLDLLRRDGVRHQPLKGESAVAVPTRLGELEGMLLIRWQADEGVVQLLQSIPLVVPAERVGALEEAILRINHALVVPGLGYDHDTRALYMRVLMPVYPGDGVPVASLRACFRVAVQTASHVLPGLRRVVVDGVQPRLAVTGLG